MTGQRRGGAQYGKHRTSHRSWRATRVWARRNLPPICALCDGPIDLTLNYRDPMAWTLDHIIPINVGGTNARSNLQPAHRSCNGAKGDGTKPGNARGDRWQNAPTPGVIHHQRPGYNTARRGGNYMPPEHRCGPDAKDKRAHVYGAEPHQPVHIKPNGDFAVFAFPDDTLTDWAPGQPWPPRLKPDPWQYDGQNWRRTAS